MATVGYRRAPTQEPSPFPPRADGVPTLIPIECWFISTEPRGLAIDLFLFLKLLSKRCGNIVLLANRLERLLIDRVCLFMSQRALPALHYPR